SFTIAILLAASGCDRCVSGDLDCVMTHLSLTMDGRPVSLVRLPASMVVPSAPNSTSTGPSTDSLQFRITPLSVPNFGDPVAMIRAGVAAQPGTAPGNAAIAPTIT